MLGSIATGSVVVLVTRICDRERCPVEDISILTGVTLVASAGEIKAIRIIKAACRMTVIPSSSKVRTPADARLTGADVWRLLDRGDDEADGFAIRPRH